MSGSYRLLFAVFAGLILAGVNQPDQGQAPQDSTSNAKQAVADTSKVASSAQPVASPTPKPNLSSSARDQSYYDREDLKAQRDMAKWTRVMGIAAVIGTVVGVIGVGLIWTTFRETQKAATAALATHRSYVANERAVLQPKDSAMMRDAPNQPHKLQFRLAVSNRGRGNGIIRKFGVSAQTDAEWPQAFQEEIDTATFVQSGDDEAMSEMVVFNRPSDDNIFWLLGYIEYETLVHERFFSFFTYHVSYFKHATGAGSVRLTGPKEGWRGSMRKFPSCPADT